MRVRSSVGVYMLCSLGRRLGSITKVYDRVNYVKHSGSAGREDAHRGRRRDHADRVDHALVLAGAAENLFPARMQMALSLGWHIVFSFFGLAVPESVGCTERRG